MNSSTEAKNGRPFFGGIITDIELKMLWDKFGLPAVGRVITYQELEDACDVKRGTNRFQTVVQRWIKRLRTDHNILMECKRGEGYFCASPKERIEYSGRKCGQAVKAITRASLIAETTDEDGLTESEKAVRRSLAMRGAAVRLAIATSAKSMEGK